MNRIHELHEGASAKQADLYRQLKWKQSRSANYKRGARTLRLGEAGHTVHTLNALGVTCSMVGVFPESETGAERLAS